MHIYIAKPIFVNKWSPFSFIIDKYDFVLILMNSFAEFISCCDEIQNIESNKIHVESNAKSMQGKEENELLTRRHKLLDCFVKFRLCPNP